MDLKEVIRLMTVFCCLTCVFSNEGIQVVQSKSPISKTNLIAANSGDNSEANGYNVLHDFNFPDVTYPTSVLESCQPFYFNSNSNGLEAIVGPFSSDVKSNYRSLLSSNENKIKVTPNNKSVLIDEVAHSYPIVSEDNALKQNKSEGTDILEVIRDNLRKFREKNEINHELEEIFSILYSGEANEYEDLVINHYNINEDVAINEDTDQYLNNSNIEEKIPKPFNKDIYDNLDLDNSSVDENVTELIIKEDSYHNLNSNGSNVDEDIPEVVDEDFNTFSKLNSGEQVSEFIIEKNYHFVNSSNCNNDEIEITEDETIEEDISIYLNNFNVNKNLSHSVQEDNHNYLNINNSNIDKKIAEPINTDVDFDDDEKVLETTDSNFNINQNVNEPFSKDTNQSLILKSDENIPELSNIDEGTKTIPKESVVFDVVYKDGYNLEKPMLDIVPSNIPVRLKINIEICKHDSSEKTDLYMPKTNEELLTFNPIENDIVLDTLDNSIENIEEEEFVAEEQITVLDEINESDFISALSILLLDSLNNKPIEIMTPEIINAESSSNVSLCDTSLECSTKYKDNETLTNNFESEDEKNEPIAVPDFTDTVDKMNNETTEYTNPNVVKYINTSPLIDILCPLITTDQFQEANVNIDDISEELNMLNLEESKEYKEPGKAELVEICPLLSLLSTKGESTTNLIQEIISKSDEISPDKTITEKKEEIKEDESIKYADSIETWPLVNVFQLKIKECNPDVKDISEESIRLTDEYMSTSHE